MSMETGQEALPYTVPATREYTTTLRTFTVTEHHVCDPDVILSADARTGLTIHTDDGRQPPLSEHPALAALGLVGLFWTTLLPLVGGVVLLLLAPLLGLLAPVLVLGVSVARTALEPQDQSPPQDQWALPSLREEPFHAIALFGVACLVSAASYTTAGTLMSYGYLLSSPLLVVLLVGSIVRVGYAAVPLIRALYA